MGTIAVRFATPDDIPAVLALLRELAAYEGKLDRVSVDEGLMAEHPFGEHACIEVLIGLSGGSAVGYAIFFPYFGSYRGRCWLYLEDLYVQPGARGAGVGRAMMAHLAGLTVKRGWVGMMWSVLDWNEGAFAFYRRLGAAKANGHVAMDLTGDALVRLAEEGSAGLTTPA
jgi:GNAT superfamily N-acetyltransferase